jgi:hypothetical protein
VEPDMTDYLIDTNILIDYLAGSLPPEEKSTIDKILTAMDIWLNLQQLGLILAPFGIAFRTHGSQFNSNSDREFFRSDELVVRHTRGIVNNVIEVMQLDTEAKLKGKLVPVTE